MFLFLGIQEALSVPTACLWFILQRDVLIGLCNKLSVIFTLIDFISKKINIFDEFAHQRYEAFRFLLKLYIQYC